MEGLPRLGQLVFSKAGRDRGRPMVVVAVADDRHVLVCDGESHPAERPKRKNVRHLAPALAVHDEVARGGRPLNSALRAWIEQTAPAEEVDR